jgi:hypothetical protein
VTRLLCSLTFQQVSVREEDQVAGITALDAVFAQVLRGHPDAPATHADGLASKGMKAAGVTLAKAMALKMALSQLCASQPPAL